MNTRGLMELIVLNLGMDLGVISPTMFTMLVIMALVTTFATTPILRWVYPDHEIARDRLVEPAEVAPEGEPAFTVMMCVSDATAGPGLATVAASLMGKRDQPASLLALHLYRPTDRPSVELRRADDGKTQGPLEPLLAHAQELMLEVRSLVLAECQAGYDLVVIGMHARWGLGPGAVSLRRQRVLAEAPVSILAVHPPAGHAVSVPNLSTPRLLEPAAT